MAADAVVDVCFHLHPCPCRDTHAHNFPYNLADTAALFIIVSPSVKLCCTTSHALRTLPPYILNVNYTPCCWREIEGSCYHCAICTGTPPLVPAAAST